MAEPAPMPQAASSPEKAALLDDARWTPRIEAALLSGLLLLVFACFMFRLREVVLSDMDEGTYLYAGKLVAEGRVPYRDFLLVHPPLLVYLAAGFVELFGADLMAARMAYMGLILLGTAPLYAIARKTGASPLAALLGIVLYTTGMLFLANMGRTVRLEPLANAFLIAAFACWMLRPRSLGWRTLGGVLGGLALLVKLVAVIPIAFFVLGELVWQRDRGLFRALCATAAGALLVLLPAAVWLLNEPGFVDAVFRSQVNRPSIGPMAKLGFVRQDFVRYPVLPLGLVLAGWLIAKGRDPALRTLALVVLGGSLALVLGFKTFFGYYLVLELPWVAVLAGLYAAVALSRYLGARARPALAACVLLVGGPAALAYAQVYYRNGHGHVSSPARIVAELQRGTGYMYSMYPSFSLASHRELYPWFHVADSLIPRITGTLRDEDLIRVFSGSNDLVLWSGELAPYSRARAYVEQHFRMVYEDSYYALWTRR